MIARSIHLAVLSTCTLVSACNGDSGGDTGSTTDLTTDAPATTDVATGTDPGATDGLPGTSETGPTTGVGDTSTVTTIDPSTGATVDTTTGDSTTGSTGAVDPGTDTGDDSSTGTSSSGSSSSGSSTGVEDTDTDGDSSTGEPSPWDGEPLPLAPEGVWTWVDFPEAKCRDGSTTGVGVRYGSGDGLVIYFQSGGACFNAATCGQNIINFGAAKFAAFMAQNGTKGVFDPTVPNNPIGDWSYIFVPYCTGDVHAGAQPDGKLVDVPQVQQFVGYLNVGLYLERVVPTFLASADHVLVTGESAGGFGSLFNYDRIATAFPDRPVTLVDDSGPILPDEYMSSCLQTLWRESWNLDANLPADCTSCFPQDGGGLINIFPYLDAKYPDQSLGVLSSLGDSTISYFFEFGLNACQGGKFKAGDFAAGLAELRDVWMKDTIWGSYYPAGTQHTWLMPSYYTSKIDGVGLVEWISDLLAGTATHLSD